MRFVLTIGVCLMASGLAVGAEALPEGWGPPTVECECEEFDRGNVRPDPGIYGPQGWAIMNAEKMPNYAEYDIETP